MSNLKNMSRRGFIKSAAVAGAAAASAGVLGGFHATPAMAAGVPDTWDKEVDVIVVGSGFTGLAAGITAQEAGAKVVVLEKAPKEEEGGNSRVSGNMWWTPTDEENGFKYVQALSFGETDDESIHALVAEMVKLNDWLSSKFGVVPKSIGGLFQPEHPELPGHEAVRTWGNNGQTLASQLYIPIRAYADKINLEFMYATPAKELIQAPTGEIVGVKASSGGKDIFIKASRGVVLGSGGFEFDFDMAKQFLPGWPVYGRGTPHNTGDGIKMAQKVGAQLWHMNNTLGGFGCLMVPDFAPVLINLAMPAQGYIFTDKFGKRFMNESRENRHGFGHKEFQLFFDGVLGQFTRNPWWTVFDETTRITGPVAQGIGTKFTWFNSHSGYTWTKDNSDEVAKGWILSSPDLGELASKMQVDSNILIDTVNKYNEYCSNKVDLDFARPKANLIPLSKGPFYAMQTYPATYNTQGGPRRNAKCQILDAFGAPIPHLYSGGEMGSFWGWMYNGGGNNAEALSTGQIAGRNVSGEKPWSSGT